MRILIVLLLITLSSCAKYNEQDLEIVNSLPDEVVTILFEKEFKKTGMTVNDFCHYHFPDEFWPCVNTPVPYMKRAAIVEMKGM